MGMLCCPITKNPERKYAVAHEVVHANIINSGKQSQYQNNQIGDDKKALPVYNLTSDGKIEKVNDLEELLLVGIPAYQKVTKNGKETYIQIKGKDIETNINKLRREDGLSIKRRKYKNVD